MANFPNVNLPHKMASLPCQAPSMNSYSRSVRLMCWICGAYMVLPYIPSLLPHVLAYTACITQQFKTHQNIIGSNLHDQGERSPLSITLHHHTHTSHMVHITSNVIFLGILSTRNDSEGTIAMGRITVVRNVMVFLHVLAQSVEMTLDNTLT